VETPDCTKAAMIRFKLRGDGKRDPDSQCEKAASVQPIAKASVACLQSTRRRIPRSASPKDDPLAPGPRSRISLSALTRFALSEFASVTVLVRSARLA
jgi:hypothetical protein